MWVCRPLLSRVSWTAVQGPGTFIKKTDKPVLSRGKMSYRIHTTDAGAWPAHRPVGPGLQIFGLIPLPFGIS